MFIWLNVFLKHLSKLKFNGHLINQILCYSDLAIYSIEMKEQSQNVFYLT